MKEKEEKKAVFLSAQLYSNIEERVKEKGGDRES